MEKLFILIQMYYAKIKLTHENSFFEKEQNFHSYMKRRLK